MAYLNSIRQLGQQTNFGLRIVASRIGAYSMSETSTSSRGQKPVRVGIIGCGRIAQAHIRAILRLEGVEIVGVCDSVEERAREVAHQFGIRHVYRDVSSILKERHIDVVHVLTPPQSHKDVSIQAMEAGCHVLVEKPMALDVKEADEMIAASQRHGVTLCVCHNQLYEPVVTQARELVAQGTIGKVVAVEIFWGTLHSRLIRQYRNTQWLRDLPGGIFQEIGPHILYLQMEFLKNLRVVSAVARSMGNILPGDDELRVLFEGGSGLGSLSFSVNTKPFLKYLNIYGTESTIRIDLTNSTLVTFTSRPRWGSQNIEQGLQLLAKAVGHRIRNRLGQRIPPHRVLIERFYESLLKRTAPPVTAEDGRAVVAVLDQIWAELNRTAPAPRNENES